MADVFGEHLLYDELLPIWVNLNMRKAQILRMITTKKFYKKEFKMGILSWIVVGLLAGWLAGLVVKGGGYGCVGDIVVGVIGALLGGWIASYFFHMGDPISGINLQSILIAFVGAVIFVIILRLVTGKRV
jgi:uncharacterized membrane protein YeaQ/YmgE (transglycosylase-associated protein family)